MPSDSLDTLDARHLPAQSAELFAGSPELDALLRRRSPPTLWFLMRRLPPLYSADLKTRFDLCVTQLLLRVLMYTTTHDHHSGLDTLCEAIDGGSLERFSLALLEHWMGGPRLPDMIWALHAQRLLAGLGGMMHLSEHLLTNPSCPDEELELVLHTIWQHELFGVSFLHLFAHHPEARLSMLAKQLLEQERARVQWQSRPAIHYERELLKWREQLIHMKPVLDTCHVERARDEFIVNDSEERQGADTTHANLSAEAVLAGSPRDREVWLALDLFERLAERWRELLHMFHDTQHRWAVERWEQLFFEDDITASWSRGVVWAAQREEGSVTTFRVAEDATLADMHDDSYDLVQGSQITVADASCLSSQDIKRWGALFADYELISPLIQFSTSVCYEWDRAQLETFMNSECRGKTTSRQRLISSSWRSNPSGAPRGEYWRKRITTRAQRLVLGVDVDVRDFTVNYVSVLSRVGSFMQRRTTMNLKTLDVHELRVIAAHLMQLFE